MLGEDIENNVIVPNFSANHSEALPKTKQAMRGKRWPEIWDVLFIDIVIVFLPK